MSYSSTEKNMFWLSLQSESDERAEMNAATYKRKQQTRISIVPLLPLHNKRTAQAVQPDSEVNLGQIHPSKSVSNSQINGMNQLEWFLTH